MIGRPKSRLRHDAAAAGKLLLGFALTFVLPLIVIGFIFAAADQFAAIFGIEEKFSSIIRYALMGVYALVIIRGVRSAGRGGDGQNDGGTDIGV